MQTSTLATSRSEAAHFSVFLSVAGDPVNSRVVSDSTVGGINHDDLVPLIDRVLTNPIRVQNSKRSALASGPLLGDRAQVSNKLLLSDTGVLGLSVIDTLRHPLLSVTSLHSYPVDHISLLGLVTQAMCFIGARRLTGSMDSRQLSIFPST